MLSMLWSSGRRYYDAMIKWGILGAGRAQATASWTIRAELVGIGYSQGRGDGSGGRTPAHSPSSHQQEQQQENTAELGSCEREPCETRSSGGRREEGGGGRDYLCQGHTHGHCGHAGPGEVTGGADGGRATLGAAP